MVRRSRTEIFAVEGSRSCETMWWPRKPQPPITRTEVESLGGEWVVAMILVSQRAIGILTIGNGEVGGWK